jgi:hypothetical protein
MHQNNFILLAVTLTTALNACTPPTEKSRHTVEEYLADDALRKGQFSRCANDPGSIGETPDCVNAREAERRANLGSFRNRFRPTPPGMPAGKSKD